MTTTAKYTPVTHVIFDMDGLLLDTESRYEKAIRTVTLRYGKDYPFELKLKIMGRTGQETAELITDYLKLPITVEEYLEQINIEYMKVFDNVDPMPGAEQLVKHLYVNSIPLAVATSSKKSSFDAKTKHLQRIFNLFDHILIASDDPEIKRGKPDPQTFLVCAKRWQNQPKDMKNVLVFEDSPAGVTGALAAGMQCVWVPDKRLKKDMVDPTLILDSLIEFKPEEFGLPPLQRD